MKISYNRKQDIILLEAAKGKIDYAEEIGQVIVHFSKDNKPVLLEILDASEFLSAVTKVGMTSEKEELVRV